VPSIPQLANTDPTIVKEEFDRYNSALEERKAVEQIQIARMMKRHYERQQGGSGDVNRTLLGADCAALAKSWSDSLAVWRDLGAPSILPAAALPRRQDPQGGETR